MSITEKLTASKNALASLLTFANAKTGKSDPDIGEAIRTLVDGYGGGGGIKVSPDEIQPSRIVANKYYNNRNETNYNGWSIRDYDVSAYDYIAIRMAASTPINKSYTCIVDDSGNKSIYTSNMLAEGPLCTCICDVKSINIFGMSAATSMMDTVKVYPCSGSL